MSLHQSFQAYFASFDGSERDFCGVSNLFDNVYHDEFLHEMDGKHPLNKSQLRQIQANNLALGTKVTILRFLSQNDANGTPFVEFEMRVVNEKTDVIIHNSVMLKENKFFRAKSCGGSFESVKKTKNVSDFYEIEKKLRSFIKVYDGKIKTFEEVEELFESLFHQGFVHTMDGTHINKDQYREAVKKFLAVGTKVDLLCFKQIDDSQFETKTRVISNEFGAIIGHSVGTVKDGKLIKLDPFDKSVYTKFSHFLQNGNEMEKNNLTSCESNEQNLSEIPQ